MLVIYYFSVITVSLNYRRFRIFLILIDILFSSQNFWVLFNRNFKEWFILFLFFILENLINFYYRYFEILLNLNSKFLRIFFFGYRLVLKIKFWFLMNSLLAIMRKFIEKYLNFSKISFLKNNKNIEKFFFCKVIDF